MAESDFIPHFNRRRPSRSQLNAVADRAVQGARAAQVFDERRPLIPWGGGDAEAKWLKITAKAGISAPFTYSGVEVAWNGSTWDEGGSLGTIKNLCESYIIGANPLPIDGTAICRYTAASDGTCFIEVSPYKGTFA